MNRKDIEQVIGSGLFESSDEGHYSGRGCDYCSPGMGNTVYDIKGYRNLEEAHADPEGNLIEFELCGQCLNDLYYGKTESTPHPVHAALRQMCMCENAQCPYHVDKACDVPAVAKVRWHGFVTDLCQQCLDMAAQTDAGALQIIKPLLRSARLFKKGARTGNETFDRVWSDFHGKMSAPENEDREFQDVLAEHEGKKQLLIALGKLNFMVDNDSFAGWIAEGYASTTGDILLKQLPRHNHEYPMLSKIREMVEEVLKAYSHFGIQRFADLDGLFETAKRRNILWDWFRKDKKGLFRFRGRVTEPYDLEFISGKWGHTRLDEEPLTDELVEKYEAELAETEDELAQLPSPSAEKKDGKATKAKRADLLELQAELDSVLEALHYRQTLKKEWDAFKAGAWAHEAETALTYLDERYDEEITLTGLVDEAAELFNATPDEVFPIEQKGENLVQDAIATT